MQMRERRGARDREVRWHVHESEKERDRQRGELACG